MISASNNYNKKQKKFYFKAYEDLSQLENALNYLIEAGNSPFQVSILGKSALFYYDKDIETSKDATFIKAYWKDVLGKFVNFGNFYNPESGSVFIVGYLVPTFLHKINGKSLATLSSGPYGIFRGIGVSETQASNYLKLLNTGNYLLILRGNKNEVNFL